MGQVYRSFIPSFGEHAALQSGYSSMGFVGVEMRRFPHLPFSVMYMSNGLA